MFYHLIYPLHEAMSFLNVFRYITVRSAFAAITAFLITLLIGEYVIKQLKKHKVREVIREEGPKKHRSKRGTPTMGGIIILFAFMVSVLLWGRFDNSYMYVVLIAALWFAGIGFVDDYMKLKIGNRGLPGKQKLFWQFVGALIVMAVYIFFEKDTISGVSIVNVPFIKNPFVIPVWLYVVFTVLIIAGWSNAVNLTDGLDGLATGLSLFVFVMLVILAYIIGNVKMSDYLILTYIAKSSELTVVCAAFVGALLGFLWFNSYPAQVFMGDTGALMLGGVIGTIAVLIKQELLLLAVGMIFVVEVFSVILQVSSYKLTKKRIFKMAPLHHHYQLKGISEPKIIVRFWITAIIVLLLTLSTLKLR